LQEERAACGFASSRNVFALTKQDLLRSVRSVCIIALWLLALTGAEAAQIAVKPLDSGPTLVVVDGELDLADIDAFRIKTESLPVGRTTVEFNSKGGSLLAGIRIGALIRTRKFTTLVPDGAQCASACALAWLGGTRRLVGEYASVGFHTAYIVKTGGLAESGPGNAILGAYLNQLGLSEKAIIYITHAAPTSMQWMSMEEAAEYGITVAKLPPAQADPGPAGAVVAQQPEGSQERRAIEFVLALLERWSGPNAELLTVLHNGLYTDKVLYYGKSESRQTVLLTKRRFANRWAQRAYTVRPSSLTATCAEATATCRVKGTMTWKFHAANTTSHGVASFEYSIVLNDEGPRIAAETSSVNEDPPVASSSSSLGQVGRSIQQLLAKLSKPAKTPTKPATKASTPAKPSTPAPAKASTPAPTKAPTKASTQTLTKESTKASTQASIRPTAPVAR
jgi:hypothetical protein